jgi:hypothetical protein
MLASIGMFIQPAAAQHTVVYSGYNYAPVYERVWVPAYTYYVIEVVGMTVDRWGTWPIYDYVWYTIPGHYEIIRIY